MAVHEVSTPETEMHDVQLFKNDLGLGITVAGYVCDEENISGIFVKDICRGSAADLTGNLQINDRIVKVDGKAVTTLNNHQAIEVLRNSGPAVIISVERYLRGPKYERLQKQDSQTCSLSPVENNKENGSTIELETTFQQSDPLRLVFDNIEEKGYFERSLSSSEQTLCNQANESASIQTVTISETNSDLGIRKMMPDNFSMPNRFQENEVKSRLVEVSSSRNDNRDQSVDTSLHNQKNENTVPHTGKIETELNQNFQLICKSDSSVNSDSSCIFYSETSDYTEKDGYETCIDESLSEEICLKSRTEDDERSTVTPIPEIQVVSNYNNNTGCMQSYTSADSVLTTCVEPPDDYRSDNVESTDLSLELSLYKEDNLHSYSLSDFVETDEFFLVGCLDNSTMSENELSKSLIDSSVVPEPFAVPIRTTYKCLKLKEYYNDYEGCLEEYNIFLKTTSRDPSPIINSNSREYFDIGDILREDVCVPQILQFKSSSEPQLVLTFEESELCQDFETRRHSFLPSYDTPDDSGDQTMTVTSKQLNFNLEKNSNDKVLANHWGTTRKFHIYKEPDETLGISIVCGKVDLQIPNAKAETTFGIFVKSIVPNSAAGKTDYFHPGDRILEIDGVDVTEAGHEQAVNAIRSAENPITFVVQSLVPLNTIHQSFDKPTDEYEDVQPSLEEYIFNTEVDLIQNHIDQISVKNKEVKQENDTIENEDKKSKQENEEKETAEIELRKSEQGEESEEDDEDEYNVYNDPYRTNWKQRITTKDGQKIDHASAGNFKRSDQEIADDSEEEDDFGYTNTESLFTEASEEKAKVQRII